MRLFLYFFSIIFKLITSFRNYLFDHNILKSKQYNIPVICVGNLSVGGSGKTPHINLIAKLLSQNYKIAIISRGYKRNLSGFNYVEIDSNAYSIGDEPLQIKNTNPSCIVAVNNDRQKAIEKIINDHPKIDIILLDDGFQHRKVRAGLNIITTPFKLPYINNQILPLGTLREAIVGADRADIIIVSKSPDNLSIDDKLKFQKKLNIKNNQTIFFSKISYGKFKCLQNGTELQNKKKYDITLVTGIADADPLINYLLKQKYNLSVMKFSDHHKYTNIDVKKILYQHLSNKNAKKLILTTEKDATKLKQFLNDFKGESIYYIPIDVVIYDNQIFEKKLLDYVSNN